MADNENVTTTNTPGSIEANGIPVITMELNASSVIPNAVDPTLRISGEAADAGAVGQRFDSVEEDVSGISYDLYGTDDSDPECLRIAQRLDTIEESMVSTTDIDTTLSTAGKVADAKAAGDAIKALNGSTLKYEGSGTDTIKDTVDGLEERVDTLEDNTANEILYETGGSTIKQKVDAIQTAQPFAVSIPENLQIERYTVEDSRITTYHAVVNMTATHSEDITWTTGAGSLTVNCAAGIPAMVLMLCVPKSN